MSKLPQVKSKDLKKILVSLGFITRQGKGSHEIFKHLDGRRTVISNHKHPLCIGTLMAILKQVDLSVNEFLELFKKI